MNIGIYSLKGRIGKVIVTEEGVVQLCLDEGVTLSKTASQSYDHVNKTSR